MIMEKVVTISVKIPGDIYAEMALRIPEGERSSFIRDAIIEKISKTPRSNKLLELEQRIKELENDLSEIKRYLGDLEILTYERGKINPHIFCTDNIDHDIINYLLHYKSATTPEIAEALDKNRWLILNRLKRIQSRSKQQLGKTVMEYYAGEKHGRKKSWWLNEELIETS